MENRILEDNEVRYPVGETRIPTSDYIHRMATIDIHIALKVWLDSFGGEMLNVSAYFDKP